MTRLLAAVPALPVSDERRAVDFFTEVLGFEELLDSAGRGLGILVRDAVQIHMWVADGSAPGAERNLAGSASCRIQVEGVSDLYQRCADMGVTHPNAPLRRRDWGVDEFGVCDPDGNLLTLYEESGDQ